MITITPELLWLAVGFAGQFIFFLRFVVQWVHSERRGRSSIPVAFWYLSIFGAVIILAYAIYRLDPVFILGQGLAIIIYVRNLALIRKKDKELPKEDTSTWDQKE